MKEKKLFRKLSLNKKTVSNLDNQDMGDAKGGVGTRVICCTIECITLVTNEFNTCDCTYYCSDPAAGCPSAG